MSRATPRPNAANTAAWTRPLGSASPVATPRGKRPQPSAWTAPLPRVTVQSRTVRS